MLELIVFLSGASVMILEMVGSRVLAPYLGTSIIVWTSLIGIVLAFLALGSWIGGKFADKYLLRKFLSYILVAAGLGTAIMGFIHPIIGQMVASSISNIYLAVLAATVLLLALPGLFFGMVSPYIIRLSLKDIDTSGKVVGRLYALSTVGSILGTFLGGLVLISWFSTTQILFGIAFEMILLSLFASREKFVGRFVLLFLVVGSGYLANYGFTHNAKIINTRYNSIMVMDGTIDTSPRLMRFLITDPGGWQSAMYIDNPIELAVPYTQFYRLGTYLKPEPEKILMLGGGAYSFPRYLLESENLPHNLEFDIVEIDPGITKVAIEDFGVPNDERLNIVHQDARMFLNENKKKYDIVLVDVFGSYYSIPFHMTTVEAMSALKNATAEDGIIIMNVISSLQGEGSQIFAGIYSSLAANFTNIHVFTVGDKNDTHNSQNLILIAHNSNDASLLEKLSKNYTDVPGKSKTIVHMLARQVYEYNTETITLTDEFAPIERYVLNLRQ